MSCPLTRTQLAVVRLLAEGMTYKQAAARRHCSPSTIRTHVHKAIAAVGVTSGAQLVICAERAGWTGSSVAPHDRLERAITELRLVWHHNPDLRDSERRRLSVMIAELDTIVEAARERGHV